MAKKIRPNLTEEFLQSLEDIEPMLLDMLFKKDSIVKKGFAYFVLYNKVSTSVEFIFGAPEFQIEIIICDAKGKYEFRDLMAIPAIKVWINDNRYIQKSERNLKDEMTWFIELLRFSLNVLD
ncbi:MAG: hypothetical protein ABIN94_15040 [Ferruginibacter sp.]